MELEDHNGCDDASDGYTDVAADAIYALIALTIIGIVAVIAWAVV